jgi:hypothetical protein
MDRESSWAILDRLLGSPAQADRIAGLDAAARLAADVAVPGALELTVAPSVELRAAAVRMLASVPGRDDARRGLLRACDDDAERVRETAADALAGDVQARPELVALLDTGSERAQAAAALALAGRGAAARNAIRPWFSRQLERAELLYRTRAALGTHPVAGSPLEFLASVLELRRRDIEDRLVRVLAGPGTTDSSGPIRRSLRAGGPDVRAQAVEALEAVGDRQLARSLARLIDDGAHIPVPDDGTNVVTTLARDPDPWIRLLATMATRELGGFPMPDTHQTLSTIERMLFLRRVPLFAALAPEDLQRLASTALERLYLCNDALVREGDPGDELIVIAEGHVRVVMQHGSEQRPVREYHAGDHIGELAVLTSRPRSATVVAAASSVRGLVIDGPVLRAVVRERPDAAMAMLVTLAERIGNSEPS